MDTAMVSILAGAALALLLAEFASVLFDAVWKFFE